MTRSIVVPPFIQDTREQTPWEFDHPTIIECLTTGDYSVQGMEDLVVIERKQHNEFVQCITHGRDRFERELIERGATLHRLHVVVEASLGQVLNGEYESWPNMTHPAAIRGTIIAWEGRYPWLRFWFPGDRPTAITWSEHLLKKSWSDFVQGKIPAAKAKLPDLLVVTDL